MADIGLDNFTDYFDFFFKGTHSDEGLTRFHNISGDEGGDCDGGTPIPHLAIVEVFISFFGLIFNGIAIFVIIRLKDYKKIISHWYVLHLSIADVILLFHLPFQAFQHFKGYWTFPHWMCRLNQGVFMMSYYAGILFLTVMSFDRYLAIVHPVHARWRRIRTHGNAIIVTVVVWLLSFVLSLPLWYWSNVNCICGYSFKVKYDDAEYYDAKAYEQHRESLYNSLFEDYQIPLNATHSNATFNACKHTQESPLFLTWIVVNFVVAFAVPFVVMGICYALILWRVSHPAISAAHTNPGRRRKASDSSNRKESIVKSSFRSSASSNSSSFSVKLTRKQKVTVVVVSLVGCFLICWSPFQIVQLIKIEGLKKGSSHECDVINDFTYLLAYANSMLNPIFYTFLGSDFRQRLRLALQLNRRRRWPSRFSKANRTNRTSVPIGRSFGSSAQQKAMEGPSACPMQTIHSMVSKHYINSQDFSERARLMSSRMKECSSKCEGETCPLSDVSEARLIH